MKRNILYTFLYILITMTSACRDDMLEVEDDFIPEGTSRLTAVVNFKPLTPALNGTSRTQGDAIKAIQSLSVLLYDQDSNLIKKQVIENYTIKGEEYRDNADAENGTTAESQTPHAEFSISIPYGRYFMYAVANLGNLENHDVSTIKKLKSIPLEWEENIRGNDQMLGHFTINGQENSKDESLVINQKRMTLHSWIRRVVSKVTVAYDASELKEGVFIYLKSVQIKDIPNTCFLGDTNTIKDEKSLISEGEIIYYYKGENIPTFDEKYPVRLATGVPKYGEHSETSNALFFFENMQGAGEKMPSKLQDANNDGILDHPGYPEDDSYRLKDAVPCGTYIEVDAYYVSINPEKVGSGSIKYRFMLGKDVEQDYNAERNYHYKLTLKFKNFANDADWHIEYKEPKPGIEVPNPYYISYLYNHSMMLPLKINTGNHTIKKIETEIIDNRWAPNEPGDFNYHRAMDLKEQYQCNGFLSLHKTDSTVITGPEVISKDVNKTYYEQVPKRGERTYTDMSDGFHSTENAQEEDKYSVKSEKSDSGMIYHVALPMYTRAKQLIKASAYTGNNPYVAYQRKAVVRIVVTLENGDTLQKDVTIYQVRRIVNPKGIWRSHNNDKSFHVELKRLPGEDATKFQTFPSEGPWKAYIVRSTENFTNLSNGVVKGAQDTIYGKTGSNIDFWINFNGTCAKDKSRYAIVRVEYHNYTCYHLIFVRQGYAPDNLISGGTKWHTCNMKTVSKETDSPVEEGSLFKFGNWEQPIDAMSNKNPIEKKNGYWTNIKPEDFEDDKDKLLSIAGTTNTSLWENITYKKPEDETFSTPNEATWKVASLEDYANLYNDPDIEQGFGILYGDEATQTADDINEAYGYDYENRTGRGMRGCFVYNKITGKNLFFPIGASGYGHRRANEKNGWGNVPIIRQVALRYSCGRITYFSGTSTKYPDGIDDAPLFYDLFMRPGAIYWLDKQVTQSNNSTLAALKGAEVDALAWDFNYFTFDFFPISASSVNTGADACFVRCVEK